MCSTQSVSNRLMRSVILSLLLLGAFENETFLPPYSSQNRLSMELYYNRHVGRTVRGGSPASLIMDTNVCIVCHTTVPFPVMTNSGLLQLDLLKSTETTHTVPIVSHKHRVTHLRLISGPARGHCQPPTVRVIHVASTTVQYMQGTCRCKQHTHNYDKASTTCTICSGPY